MRKLLKALDLLEDIILVSMFAAMVAVIFMQVIMRYVFNNSLSWSEELGKFLFVWLSWFGISIGARRKEHIKITMLVDKLPYRVARVLDLIAEAVVIAICVVTAVYGVSLVRSQSAIRYAGIRISISWGYLSVVVGCALMTIRGLAAMIEDVRAMKIGKPLASNGGS